MVGLGTVGGVDGRDLGQSVCVVAVGGYGREALCPHSDVDVLILWKDLSHKEAEGVCGRLLYPLWDGGLQVGHRQGSVDDVLKSCEQDPVARTALLDLRYVAGSRLLFDELSRRSEGAWESWKHNFPSWLRDDNAARFRRYGESVFLLEPNVKEGKGGLRDIHWLLWAARAHSGARTESDLLLKGVVSAEHYSDLMAAYDFLMRARSQLHLHLGRAEDRLLFDYQEPVARSMGFQARGGLKAVERFMGAYYGHAYRLAHLVGLYVARMYGFYWDETSDDSLRAAGGTLVVGPSAPRASLGASAPDYLAEGVFVCERGTVRSTQPGVFRERPISMLELFAFLQRSGGRLHHETSEQVHDALAGLGKRFRASPEAGGLFREILEGVNVFRTLVAMHRSGFLGRFLPEFGACFCQAQHSRMHLYTVDIHCLYVVRELERQRDESAKGPMGAFWTQPSVIQGPLILAGLLHDVAKASGTAHSRVGAQQTSAVLTRLGYSQEDTAFAEWLVRHHLLLSDVAYQRDLNDPATHAQLRAVLPDRRHLDALLQLTWADTRATNPSRATSWKKALLEQAWHAARNALSEAAGDTPEDLFGATRARVEALLGSELSRAELEPLVARVFDKSLGDPGVLSRYRPEDLALHALLLGRLSQPSEDGLTSFVSDLRVLTAGGVSRWTVCAEDRPGLFGLLAGALSTCGLNIVEADTHTRSDGICVDSFAVVDEEGAPVEDGERWTRLEDIASRALSGRLDIPAALRALRVQTEVDRRPAEVSVRNNLSEWATVVEVVAADRPGLVFDITQVFGEFRLDLRLAKISTRQDLASDTFYVVGRGGRKVGQRRLRQLARALEVSCQ